MSVLLLLEIVSVLFPLEMSVLLLLENVSVLLPFKNVSTLLTLEMRQSYYY